MTQRVSPDDLQRLGDRLRGLREDLGLSQKEAAERLGISEVGYGHFERGRRLPSAAELPWLASGLGVTVEELLGRLGLVDQRLMGQPLPDQLEGRFRRIAAGWESMDDRDRATVDQILGLASTIARPDPPTVTHDGSPNSKNDSPEAFSIIVRLNPDGQLLSGLDASRIVPARTRELVTAGA